MKTPQIVSRLRRILLPVAPRTCSDFAVTTDHFPCYSDVAEAQIYSASSYSMYDTEDEEERLCLPRSYILLWHPQVVELISRWADTHQSSWDASSNQLSEEIPRFLWTSRSVS